MASQAIQSFNTKFTMYEGIRKGPEVKSLVQMIQINNETDSIHKVEYNNISIDSTKTYNVSFMKDSNGYVNRVIIEEM